ncbi:hypothetical protein LTR10_002299 [Elasticomyces elasticus]|nr:hypothetical protein LTR10_002299 [Elasticomyces elasticus]KAK4973630.1 hypothetical protein LTR42_005619 [Elasticomyces elasticus]
MGWDFDFKNAMCALKDDSDFSGKGVRTAAQVSVIATIITAYAILATTTSYPEIAKILRNVIQYMNSLSLAFAILLIVVGWAEGQNTNWFHVRFLMDSASFAADSVLFVALVVPDYFTQSVLTIPGIVIYLGLIIPFFVDWTRMYGAALLERPGCYDEDLLEAMWIFSSINLALFVIICIVSAWLNRTAIPKQPNDTEAAAPIPMTRKRLIITTVAIVPFTMVTAAEIYWSSRDYDLLRPLLHQPSPTWTLGQILPLATVSLGVALTYWVAFDVDGWLRGLIRVRFGIGQRLVGGPVAINMHLIV